MKKFAFLTLAATALVAGSSVFAVQTEEAKNQLAAYGTSDNVAIDVQDINTDGTNPNSLTQQIIDGKLVEIYATPEYKVPEDALTYNWKKVAVTSKDGVNGSLKAVVPSAKQQADGTYKYVEENKEFVVKFDKDGNPVLQSEKTAPATANNNGGEKKAHNTVKAAATKSGAKTLPKTSAAK